jgi:ABC-type glycerol-3-phosphate transport system permease component
MSEEQGTWLLAMAVKPLIALPFLLVAVFLGRWILRKLPEGKLKTLLSRRVGP